MDLTRLGDTEYTDLFTQLVRAHCEAASKRRRPPHTWCACWPSVGNQYRPGGVMVIGRALNGWKPETEFSCDDVREPSQLAALAKRCHDSFLPETQDPMAFVLERWGIPRGQYSTRTSSFWRMAKRLSELHGGPQPNWPSHLCWTNLMRVAPARGGNPPNWSYIAQTRFAARLLEIELECLSPSVVVLLTGDDAWFGPFTYWWKFAEGPEARYEDECKHVRAHGRIGNTKIIVTEHPQGRPEEEMMEEIRQFWPQDGQSRPTL